MNRWQLPRHGGGIVGVESKCWLGRHRKLVACLAVTVVIVVAAVVVFMPGLVAPWSRLNNEEQEIDLYSGRARITRHFLWRRVRQDVRDTPVSEAIAANGGASDAEKWVMVNIFQPDVSNSPHFVYHGALSQANWMLLLWEMHKCDSHARAKTARQLLRVWREGESYHAAYDYFDLLERALGAGRKRDEVVTAEEIPEDLVERTLAKRAEEMRQQ
jgi:hypothetical protein